MYKYYLIFLLMLFSCKEKNSFKEVSIEENLLEEIQKNINNSKKSGVYIVSLFTDKGKNICEIVKYKESPTATNFEGCQLLKNDTIFLYTDKKNKYLNCYNLSDKVIKINKKQFAIEKRELIGYYKLDTLNCSIIKFEPVASDL